MCRPMHYTCVQNTFDRLLCMAVFTWAPVPGSNPDRSRSHVIQLQRLRDPDLIQIWAIHHEKMGAYLSALAGNSPLRPDGRKSQVVLCDGWNWLNGE